MWSRLVCFTILGIFSQARAFSTPKCTHPEILDSLKDTNTCAEGNEDEMRSNPCLAFETTDKCVHQYLAPCFGDDTEKMSSIMQIQIRKLSQTAVAKLNQPQSLLDTLYAKCEKVPSRQEVESYNEKMFYWFDFAKTDNNCSTTDKESVQNGLQSCIGRESNNFIRELQKRARGPLANRKNAICEAIHDTYGTCLRTKFPVCFSEREIDYMRKKVSSDFKLAFNLGMKLGKLANNRGMPNLNFDGCLEGEGVNSAPTISSVTSIMFLVLVGNKMFA